MNISQRFWAKVVKGEGCWEWQGSRDSNGYGRFGFEGRNRHAHRVSWMLARGGITSRQLVLHRCDNPPCVRLSHLYLGTQRENMLDASARGRLPRGGERNGRAKLTSVDAAEIRRLHDVGVPYRRLAEVFGVHKNAIGAVCRGETWAT